MWLGSPSTSTSPRLRGRADPVRSEGGDRDTAGIRLRRVQRPDLKAPLGGQGLAPRPPNLCGPAGTNLIVQSPEDDLRPVERAGTQRGREYIQETLAPSSRLQCSEDCGILSSSLTLQLQYVVAHQSISQLSRTYLSTKGVPPSVLCVASLA